MKNRRLRGAKSLIHDAVSATTSLVGDGHDSTGRTTERAAALLGLGEPARVANALRKLATDGVLATVRGVNRVVEVVSDLGLDVALPGDEPAEAPVPMRADAMGSTPWLADALVGAVNGVVGDHLNARGNPLDLGLSLRVAPSAPSRQGPRKFAVFIHGLATTEWSWCLGADRLLGDAEANFGTLLERDAGYTPVFARYNTGRHVSDNGRDLAAALDRLVSEERIDELVLIGHSMGGLVARSATEIADAGQGWLPALRRVVCLGTPHRGAPLERFGHALTSALQAVDLPGTRIPAAILRARSHGIKDLRHGHVNDADWRGRDLDGPDTPLQDLWLRQGDIPLLPGVEYAFFAGALTDPAHPISTVFGDLLVPVTSAEGDSTARVVTARFGGVLHHEIQVHPAVYEEVRRFCTGGGLSPSGGPPPGRAGTPATRGRSRR